MTETRIPHPSPELRDKAAIVGIGETDYAEDYQARPNQAAGLRSCRRRKA